MKPKTLTITLVLVCIHLYASAQSDSSNHKHYFGVCGSYSLLEENHIESSNSRGFSSTSVSELQNSGSFQTGICYSYGFEKGQLLNFELQADLTFAMYRFDYRTSHYNFVGITQSGWDNVYEFGRTMNFTQLDIKPLLVFRVGKHIRQKIGLDVDIRIEQSGRYSKTGYSFSYENTPFVQKDTVSYTETHIQNERSNYKFQDVSLYPYYEFAVRFQIKERPVQAFVSMAKRRLYDFNSNRFSELSIGAGIQFGFRMPKSKRNEDMDARLEKYLKS